MDVQWLYSVVTISGSAVVGQHCTIGCPKETRVLSARRAPDAVPRGNPVLIDDRCVLFNQVVLYEGVQVAEDCILEDRVRVGYDTVIGPRTRITYGAYICDRVRIGADAIVAGFVCDGSVIGDRATIMGQLVHEYAKPHRGWWEVDEEPPRIEADSVVGYGASVIGGVRIGPRSYIAAGAVVTRDVPSEQVATGVNVLTPIAQWPGRRLRDLIGHWRARR